MAHKIALALEVLEAKERDDLLDALSEVLNEHRLLSGKIVVTREVKAGRKTRKILDTIELGIGESFDLSEFGLIDETPMEIALRRAGAEPIEYGRIARAP